MSLEKEFTKKPTLEQVNKIIDNADFWSSIPFSYEELLVISSGLENLKEKLLFERKNKDLLNMFFKTNAKIYHNIIAGKCLGINISNNEFKIFPWIEKGELILHQEFPHKCRNYIQCSIESLNDTKDSDQRTTDLEKIILDFIPDSDYPAVDTEKIAIEFATFVYGFYIKKDYSLIQQILTSLITKGLVYQPAPGKYLA